MAEVLDEELRAAGFTEAARKFPRDDLAVKLICAFNGINPDSAPPGWKFFPNESTRDAWARVAEAAEAHFRQT